MSGVIGLLESAPVVSTSGLLVFVGVAFLLFLLVHGLQRLVRVAPIERRRRERWERILAAAEPLIAIAYLVGAVPMIFDETRWSTWASLLVLLGFALVAWFAVRDFVHGLFIKASRLVAPGDSVQLEAIGGTVVKLGYRTLQLETRQGANVFVPYHQVSAGAVERAPEQTGTTRHTFDLSPPAGVPVKDAVDVARLAAFTSHWCAIRPPPLVERAEDGALSVAVHTYDPLRGTDVELRVRAALDRLTDERGAR